MTKPKMEYKRNDRISHRVNHEYEIVFDRCIPVIDGIEQNEEQLLMRYTKNGNTVNNAPAFDEANMIKAIIKLFDSSLISKDSKELLKKAIMN